MTTRFICCVTRSNLGKKIPQSRVERNKKYWFYSDGTPFPQDDIGTPWSNSTYRALIEDSGGFLEQITEKDSAQAVRLTDPRVKRLIGKMREHVSIKAPEHDLEKGEGLSYVTIRNLLATFDKMIEKHDDNAYFYLA